MADSKNLRINEKIRVREVRLISDDGSQQGIVPTMKALAMAKDSGLDLVEVAPQANPPVCKILDYGKYRFELKKKMREAKKNQHVQTLREIRMQPKVQQHDMDFKARHIQEFLENGDKVKVTIRYRGRELAHPELGFGVMNHILERITTEYVIEKKPAMEGRNMSMTIAPKSKK